jgi:hypothetical protein
MPHRVNLLLALLVVGSLLLTGCPEAARLIPGLNTVELVLINDSDFPVDPNIRFDDDAGWLAGLFPAEELGSGLIEPGETVVLRFDCDELGLIFSDEAEQLVPIFGVYIAGANDILEREEEYDCGDVIGFRFVGNAEDFGVIVSVNGRIVD